MTEHEDLAPFTPEECRLWPEYVIFALVLFIFIASALVAAM